MQKKNTFGFKNLSLFHKLNFFYFLILFFLIGSIILISTSTLNSFYEKILIDQLKRRSNILLTSLSPQLLKMKELSDFSLNNGEKINRFKELDKRIKILGKESDTRVTIIDSSGVVIADSLNEPINMENHKYRPEVIQASAGLDYWVSRYSSTEGKEMFYFASPVRIDSMIYGVIRLSYYKSDLKDFRASTVKNTVILGVFFLILGFILSYIASLKTGQRLNHLKNKALEISKGNFNTSFVDEKNDEIGFLSNTLSSMQKDLKNLMVQRDQKNEEMTTLINLMDDCILLIDKNDSISYANKKFLSYYKIFDDDDNHYYWEIITQKEIIGMIEELKEHKSENFIQSSELQLFSRYFIVKGKYIVSNQSVLIIYTDITEQIQTIKLKKDFIINASHELKTPLTAINGYIETIMDENDIKTIRDYARIMERNMQRLINLISDVTTLAKIEENKSQLMVNETDVNHVFDNLIALYTKKAREKDIELKKTVNSKENVFIMTDGEKLEQILINLIDNAIKYTDKGYIQLEFESENIRLKNKNYSARISIKDSGIGIPERHLGRIFERFYCVDPSRSKSLSGTGLGLSIVKNLVYLINGEISVESIENKGSIFTLYLP